MRDNLFIELIQLSLGNRDTLSRAYNTEEWDFVYHEAQRQCVVSLLIDGLECLCPEQLPPQPILLQWIGHSQLTEATFVLQCKRAKELTERFTKQGYRSCILKGVGFSQLYPKPSHRQGGDIDLWVDGDRKDLINWLRSQCEIEHILWHHVDAKFFDDIPTEIHYHPSWLYNPFNNRRIQRWFNEEKRYQMLLDKSLGFAYPTLKFNAVYALAHLYHHLIEEGVGIRHVVDYFFILKSLSNDDKVLVLSHLKQFRMLKLTRAVMYVLQEVCGMPSDLLLCKPDIKEGHFLLEEILRGGNFGHYRNDNRKRNTLGRILALLPHYPSEVLWVVPWKLWHKCWRLINA